MLLLAPDIQEAVLFLDAGSLVTERALRVVVRNEDWREQRRVSALNAPHSWPDPRY